MTSTLKWHTCWSTVPKNSRTAASELIAHLWWRWHTQHLCLDRPDLVTSCLFLVSLMQLAVGSKQSQMYRGRCLPQLAQKAPSRQRVVQPNARAMLQLLYSSFSQTWPQRFAACPVLLSTSDSHKKVEYLLMHQFWRGLTDHCHEATPLRLLVGCQPLPSRSHARSCFSRILCQVTTEDRW